MSTDPITIFKENHDKAFNTIQRAIYLEERNELVEAVEQYKEGILLIDLALRFESQLGATSNGASQKIDEMMEKMKKTKAEALKRIRIINDSLPPAQPPSYEEAIRTSPSELNRQPISYGDLNQISQELRHCTFQSPENIIFTHPGVRLVFIAANGEIFLTLENQPLTLTLTENEEPLSSRAILQMGSWTYPITPGISTYRRTENDTFILPGLPFYTQGDSVEIIFPSNANVADFDILLENIIAFKSDEDRFQLKRLEPEEPVCTSRRVSNAIVTGASYLSDGLVRGASKVGELITNNTPKLINNLAPANQPAEIPSNVSNGIKIAKNVTCTVANVTSYVAEKVGEGTAKLGQFLAPHIHKHGTTLIASGCKMSEAEASEKMDGILTVAAGTIEGVSTIYKGIETSAGILGNNLKQNTVKVVQHRYGGLAAATADDSLDTVGNVLTSYQNAKIFRPKRILKSTGKNIIQPYSATLNSNKILKERLDNTPSHIRPSTSKDAANCQTADESSDENSEGEDGTDFKKEKQSLGKKE